MFNFFVVGKGIDVFWFMIGYGIAALLIYIV